MMMGNDVEALASFRKAVELEPDNTETLTRLSAFLERLGTADASAAKRARVASLTTVVTSIANAGAFTYDGRYTVPHGNHLLQANGPSLPDPLPEGEKKRIAFVSPHCVMDFANGRGNGHTRRTGRAGQPRIPMRGVLRHPDRRAASGVHSANALAASSAAHCARRASWPVPMADDFHVPRAACLSHWLIWHRWWLEGLINREEIAAFLTGCELFLDRFRPDRS